MSVVRSVHRVRQRTDDLFFGWWIVLGAIGLLFLQNGLLTQAYGAYVAVLTEDFGWSKTALAAAFSLQHVESGLLGPLQGWMLGRWGPRAIVRMGVIIFGAGFILFSQINSLTMFYVTFVIMAIGASLSGYLSMTTTLVNWFERRRATAMALTQTGIGLGGIITPLIAWSLVAIGWRTTALLSGVMIIVVGLPLAQLLRRSPEPFGLLPDGAPPRDSPQPSTANAPGTVDTGVDFTLTEALRTRAFWFISLGHGVAVVIISAVTVHLIVHLNEGLGFSLAGAATIVAVMTAITILGQLAGGVLGDRYSKRLLAAIAMIAHAGALLALAWGSSLIWIVLFAIIHGLAWGVRGPLMQAIRADYFGRKSFGMIMGFSSMIVMAGMVSGPIIAGLMADRFGNYQYGFTVLALLAAGGSLFFVSGSKPTAPRRSSQAVQQGAD